MMSSLRMVACALLAQTILGSAAAETQRPAPPSGFHEVTIASLRIRYVAADEGVGCDAILAATEWYCVRDPMGDWAVRTTLAEGPSAYTRFLVQLVRLRERLTGRTTADVMTAYRAAGLVCDPMRRPSPGVTSHLATCRYVPAEPVGGQTVFVKLIGYPELDAVEHMEFRRVSGASTAGDFPGSPRPVLQNEMVRQ